MIEDGTAEYTPQNSEEATHTSMISKELGFIDWTKPAVEIERLIRGLNPWPSAYTHLNGKTFKVWSAKVIDAAMIMSRAVFIISEKMICMYRQEKEHYL